MKIETENRKRPLLGVSACLLGKPVRFDGGHKRNKFVASSLADHLDYQTVCPEVEAGFPTPRPAMQLRKQGEEIRLVVSKDKHQDLTQQVNTYAARRIESLDSLDGFIFKKDSPSCGVFRVPVVVNESGYRTREGRGLFAKAFMEKYPLIPVEEEGRLNDAGIREQFLERVFAYYRWKQMQGSGSSVAAFIDFHATHKLMLMARGSSYYQELGRIVAGTTAAELEHRQDTYIHRFMQVLAMPTTRGRQVNVLQHIMGYLKNVLSSEDKQELLQVFESYRERQLPLITPITLLRHHLRVHSQPYIAQQHYLEPYPAQLALRSFS